MRKVFSVLAVIASLFIGGWAQEAEAQTIPEISVVAPDFVHEGDAILFTVVSNIEVASNLTVRIGEAEPTSGRMITVGNNVNPTIGNRSFRPQADGYTTGHIKPGRVVIDAGSRSVVHSVQTINHRGTKTAHGYYILEITGSPSEYTYVDDDPSDWTANDPSEKWVEIRDVEKPRISIAVSNPSGNTIDSGADAVFNVTASSFIPFGGLEVNVAATGNPADVTSENSRTVSFAYDKGATDTARAMTLTIATNAGNPGTLIATVQNHANYTVAGSPGNSAEFTVEFGPSAITLCRVASEMANGCPVSPVSGSVSEGTTLFFLIETNMPQAEVMNFNVQIAEFAGADFLADSQLQSVPVTIPANRGYSDVFTIATDDDRVYENDGSVRATVVNSSSAEVASAATVNVTDNDVPILTVTAPEFVHEGDTIQYRIRIVNDIDIGVSMEVSYGQGNVPTDEDVAPGGVRPGDTGFVDTSGIPQSLTFAPGDREVVLEVETTNHRGAKNGNGYYIVALRCQQGGTGCASSSGGHPGSFSGSTPYSFVETGDVSWEKNSSGQFDSSEAVVEIREVAKPTISIAPGNTINAGTDAEFTVTASSFIPFGGLDVTVAITDNPAGVTSENSRTVSFAYDKGATDTAKTMTLNIATNAGNSGTLTATVQNHANYTVPSGARSAQVIVSNPDGPLTATISGGSGITEGAGATFVISLSRAVSGSEDVVVNIATGEVSGGEFLDLAPGAQPTQVTFTSGIITRTFDVPTNNDRVDETNGSVSAEITAGTDYVIGSPATATVNVADNDIPEISLVGPDFVHEGDAILFTIVSNIDIRNRLTVRVGENEPGDNVGIIVARDVNPTLAGGMATRSFNTAATGYIPTSHTKVGTVVIEPGSRSVVYSVPTTNHRGDKDAHGYYIAEVGCTVFSHVDCRIAATGGTPTDLSVDYAYIEGPSITGWTADDPSEKWVEIRRVAPPVLEINPPSDTTISAGQTAQFTVAARSTVPVGGLVVNMSASPSNVIQGTVPATLTLPYGQTSAVYAIKTTRANIMGTTTLTATIEDSTDIDANSIASYTVATMPDNSAEVTVELGTPEISLTSGDPDNTINESESVTFTVTLDEAVSGSAVNVPITITPSSGIAYSVDDLTSGNLQIPDGSDTGTFTVTATNDNMREASGTITVALGTAPSGYANNSAANSVIITVNDNDTPPTVTISGGSGVTEGAGATFTLTLSDAASEDVVVNVATGEVDGGEFLYLAPGAQPTQITLTSGVTMHTFDVPTNDDRVDETNGSVSAEITAGTDYEIGSPATATVNVADNDIPEISLVGPDFVHEGDAILFTIVSNIDIRNRLTVRVGENEPGGNVGIIVARDVNPTLAGGMATRSFNTAATGYIPTSHTKVGTVVIEPGSRSVVYSVPTTNHRGDKTAHGYYIAEVGCTVFSHVDCRIAATGGTPTDLSVDYAYIEGPSITGWTADDPSEKWVEIRRVAPPVLEINPPSDTTINAGQTAQFTVAARSTVPVGGLVVNMSASPSNVIQGTAPATLTLPYGQTSAVYNVNTRANISGTMTLTATIEDSTDTTINSIASYTVANEPDNSAEVTTVGSGMPEISLTSGDSDNTITEGENVTFTVTLGMTASGDVNVPITITPSSGIAHTVSGLTGGNNLLIRNSDTGTFTVTATDDTMREASGTITVALGTAPSGYANNSAANSVTITVEDDDTPPTVTISGGSDITEGAGATFTLTLSDAASEDVVVNVATGEVSGGQFLDLTSGMQPTQVTLTSGMTTLTFDVPTDDDRVDETNGSVSARITAGTGYDIGSDATATVNVADNDVPTITITAHDFVHEGDTILFTVISDIELANDLTVQLGRDEPNSGTTIVIGNGVNPTIGDMSVTTAGADYTAGDSLPGSITIPAGPAGTSAVYEVDTTNHRGGEGGHGYYIVEVLCPDRKNGHVGQGNCVIRNTASPPTDTTLAYIYQDLMEGGWTANDPSEKWVRINRVAKPEISIEASENTVNPGSDVEFTVTASSFIPFGGLTVDIDLTDPDDVTDNQDIFLTFDYAGRTAADRAPGSMNFTVNTKADSMGTLTVVVRSHASYTVTSGMSSAQVTVETTQPLITLCRVADERATACPGSAVSGSVSEGSELFFLVEITEARTDDLGINTTVGGDFLASGQAGVRVITIPDGVTASEVFTVATESADFIDEDDGTVTVSIANPDTETFGLATDEVTVDITDAPFIDFCRVASSSATSCPDSALTGDIPENGGEAHFLVFISTERTEDTEVVITAGGDISRLADTAGSGFGGNQTYTATIRANQTRETITMRAFDNAVPDTPANAEIQIGFTQYSPPSGSGYLLNPDKVVSHPGTNGLFFNIIDDEAPPLPVITLCRIAPIGGTECPHTPVTDTIVEGQPAFFLFEISEAQSSGTNITVTVAESGSSFLAGGQAGARTITIPANMTTSGIFSVETQNDRNIGGDGEFTVTSANPDGARFTLAGAQHTVSVSNNDRMATATGVGGEQSVQIEIYDLPLTHNVRAMAFDPETTEDGRPHAYTVPSAEETVFTYVVDIDITPEPDPTAMFELCFPMPPLTDGQDPVIYYGGETGSTWWLQDSYTNEEMVCTMTNTASFWAVGAAENSAVDEANKMILPRIAMAVAAETAGMIQDRIKDVFSGGGDSGVSVKGTNLQELIISGAQSGEVPELQLSDFAFSLAANDSYGGGWGAVPGRMLGNISVWGRGYLLHMEDVGGSVEFDGTVTGGMAGVDTLFLPNLLAGVSGNLFTSEIDFRRSATTGTHETTAWSVHPYIGWQPSPRTTIWATGGYGMGSLEAARDGEVCDTERSPSCRESDAMIITFGGGASGRMLDRRTAGGGRVVIDAIGDVVYARFIEDGEGGVNVDAGSARFGFELTGSRPAWWGSSLGGDLELAYRGDFGDDVKGSGLEAVGSVKFGVPRWGLRIDLGGRALISHSDNLRERGLSGDIMWSRSFDGTGPFLSFNPQWGATRSKSNTIWEHGISEVEVETGAGRRYNMEAGYGVPLPYESGLMKLFARSEIVDGVVSSKIGGVDIEATGGISAGYEAVDKTAQTETEHRAYIKINGTF